MKRFVYVLALILLALAVMPAAAQEVVCPPCPPDAPCPLIACQPTVPGVFTNPEWLKIPYHRVTVDINNQIAATLVEMEFVNEGNGLAEGTFLFPLPAEAAVNELVMFINGQPIEAKILSAGEARAIYNEIVRQYRDPALLEYVGRNAVQASVFPIPPGETRKIQLQYTQILEVDNGLIHYVYPLDVTKLVTRRPIESLSVRVNVAGNDTISNIYSPSHTIAFSRGDDNRSFSAGYESATFIPQSDFSLYYGIAREVINVNLLTYRESADQDGFFMLLVQPPVKLTSDQVIPKDVIVVLDQSGSMFGDKWTQARGAAEYVLKNLNPEDRFNLVLFSTGWRIYSPRMEAASVSDEAIDWVRGQEAVGGTDINGALLAALNMADAERPVTILFLTDGLATEGTTVTSDILANLSQSSRPNVRIFTFGVGNDVDTFLLDSIVRDYRGAGTYVRPSERIDEEVASLYNRISAPVLTDVTLDFGGMLAQDMYPGGALPDLFAGTQLTLVGRYRGSADDISITLRGMVNGSDQVFVYNNLNFPERAGGEPFIAQLWATRRIGDLLNTIRLQGENPELVDSIVRLSIRYGIITPYTSFLIEEDDILSQQGLQRAEENFARQAQDLAGMASGEAAVNAADAAATFSNAQAPVMAPPMEKSPEDEAQMGYDGRYASPIQSVAGKTFILQNNVWTDTTFAPDSMTTEKVVFLSDAYFDLLDSKPELGVYFAVGDRVIVVLDGTAYEVTTE